MHQATQIEQPGRGSLRADQTIDELKEFLAVIDPTRIRHLDLCTHFPQHGPLVIPPMHHATVVGTDGLFQRPDTLDVRPARIRIGKMLVPVGQVAVGFELVMRELEQELFVRAAPCMEGQCGTRGFEIDEVQGIDQRSKSLFERLLAQERTIERVVAFLDLQPLAMGGRDLVIDRLEVHILRFKVQHEQLAFGDQRIDASEVVQIEDRFLSLLGHVATYRVPACQALETPVAHAGCPGSGIRTELA